ncbi:MAG: hypothetical protein AB7E31_13920 [Desulfitobacterium sp.]
MAKLIGLVFGALAAKGIPWNMVASTLAILTPAASAASTILFPNTQWIRPKDVYKYGSITVIVTTAIAIAMSFLTGLILY